MGRRLADAVVRAPHCADVQLLHREHRWHRTLRALPIFASQELTETLRHDIPLYGSARGELLPEHIDFVLRLATDEHRDRRLALRTGRHHAVERHELSPIEREFDDHRQALRSRGAFAVAVTLIGA